MAILCDITYGGGSSQGGLNEDTGNTTVTSSWGTRPGTFTFETAIPQSFIPKVQDVRVLQNGSEVARFKNCAVDRIVAASPEVTLFTVTVLDRRWQWWNGGGVIQAAFNRRVNGKIDEKTKKSPKELFEFVFDALEERGPILDKIPGNVDEEFWPEVSWDYTMPVMALQELLDYFSISICLTNKDKVRVIVPGDGKSLPREPVAEESISISSVARPDALLFVAGKSICQGLLEIEPVALDLDHGVKLWEDLSYAPPENDGFKHYPPQKPELAVVWSEDQEKAEQAARQSVWKWWRIKGQPSGNVGPVPGFRDVDLKYQWQYYILPVLQDEKPGEKDSEEPVQLEPYVVGQWFDYGDLGIEKTDTIPAGCTRLNTRYPYDFRVDVGAQLVKFSDPVFSVPTPDYEDKTQSPYEIPRMFLYCAYHVLGLEDRIAMRKTKKFSLPGRPTGAGLLPVRNDSVYHVVRITHRHRDSNGASVYTVDSEENNEEEFNRGAKMFIEQKKKELLVETGEDNVYGGFVDIEPDGKIRQVSWILSGGVGKTRASTSSEHAIFQTPYKQKLRVVRDEMVSSRIDQIAATQKSSGLVPKKGQ